MDDSGEHFEGHIFVRQGIDNVCGVWHTPHMKSTRQSDMWEGTEPCYCAETNAHITAFYQRNPDEIPAAIQDTTLTSAPTEVKYAAEHYDYEHQAWVGADGRWLCCAHPRNMNCRCYGRLHYGEFANPVCECGHSRSQHPTDERRGVCIECKCNEWAIPKVDKQAN